MTSMRRRHHGRWSPRRRRRRSGSGPPSTSMVAPDGAVTRMASPCPTSSATRCRRPSGRVPRVNAPSSTPATTGRAIGRATRWAAARMKPRARAMELGRACERCSGSSTSSVRGPVVAGRAKRRQTIARAGYQPSASQPGACIGMAANGMEAAACPATIMARSRSQAPPPSAQRRTSVSGEICRAEAIPPSGAAIAHSSMTSGTSGTTTTLAAGAMSESRSKLPTTTGSVVSCAAIVSATGSRTHAGQALEPSLDGAAEEDQPGRRQRRQLEADIPQHRWRRDEHDQRRQAQGRGGVRA